jgi:hypothetical protein
MILISAHPKDHIWALATTANSKTPDSNFSIVCLIKEKNNKASTNNKASSVIIILANHSSGAQLNSSERKKER